MNKIFNDIIRGTKKFTYISICALALLPLTSCTDYLDKSPDSDISDVDAFKDFTNFQGFTEELYNCMPDFARGYWTNSFNWGDEILRYMSIYMAFAGIAAGFRYGKHISITIVSVAFSGPPSGVITYGSAKT